jgi:hypothetical protein
MSEQPENQQTASIAAAFPTVAPAALDRLLGSLSSRDDVARLQSEPGSRAQYAKLAAALCASPDATLEEALPGLSRVKDEGIPFSSIPTRIANALQQRKIHVWSDVLGMSFGALFGLRWVGKKSVEGFVACAVRTSVETIARTASSSPPAPRAHSGSSAKGLPDSFRSFIRTVQRTARWVRSETDAQQLGDLLALGSGLALPPGLNEDWHQLAQIPLDDLLQETSPTPTFDVLLDELFRLVSERDRYILERRISGPGARTLQELAVDLNVTRERVRQLEARAEAKLRRAVESKRFLRIAWRMHSLRLLLGSAIPPDSHYYRESISRLMRDVTPSEHDRVVQQLLWLAGPHRQDATTGWLTAGDVPGPETAVACTDADGNIDRERLREALENCGLVPAVHDVWIHRISQVRDIDGRLVLWSGSATDKAAMLLERWGRPATAEEIVEAIDEELNVRATRSRLFYDERFMRVDKDRVALRSWGLEEYSGIADEIGQEIDRRGGAADVDDLVATLVRQFSVREQSVRAYLMAPMFIVEGTTVRRRAADEPYIAKSNFTDVPQCYRVGRDSITWRIEVNSDLLRGSGRPLPEAIGAWLNVLPGGRRELDCDGTMVNVTWPESSVMGPSLGSIRMALERHQCRPGEQVIPRFDRSAGTLAVETVDPHQLADAEGLKRLTLLTGLRPEHGNGDLSIAVVQAVGASDLPSARGILHRRGEVDLAALIPHGRDQEIEEAVENLRDLL